MDEWIGNNNGRFANIYVQNDCESFFNLGMVRVRGSMPAEVGVELVRRRLAQFGLPLDKDLVAGTTDGARVMVKLVRLISSVHQQCFAHGYHLAVCDFLYCQQPPGDLEVDEDMESDSEAESDAEVSTDEDQDDGSQEY